MYRNGPLVIIIEKCHGCKYLSCKTACGDANEEEGTIYRCVEPSIKAAKGEDALIYHDTPKWCPLREETIRAEIKELTDKESQA